METPLNIEGAATPAEIPDIIALPDHEGKLLEMADFLALIEDQLSGNWFDGLDGDFYKYRYIKTILQDLLVNDNFDTSAFMEEIENTMGSYPAMATEAVMHVMSMCDDTIEANI